MPRASWKGFLRLSLVSCPVYLSPATTRTKSIRLHQVWQPRVRGAPAYDEDEDEQPYRPAARVLSDDAGNTHLESLAPARIALHPHDPHTGEEIGREDVVKGYEYERGRFVTFTAEELKALDVEARKSSISKPLSRAPRSIRCISARRITSTRTARSRPRPLA
jgi:DNA end-binding protein Ku